MTDQNDFEGLPKVVNSNREVLISRFNTIISFSMKLTENLETEDYVIQSMPDVSPTKWHLAHTSWFFETFILQNALPDYLPTVLEEYNLVKHKYISPPQLAVGSWIVASICTSLLYKLFLGKQVKIFPDLYFKSV